MRGRTWVDFFWPLRRVVLPLMAIGLLYLTTWFFGAVGWDLSWLKVMASKTWLLAGAMTIGGLIGAAIGYMAHEPQRVKVIAPANESWTARAMWEIPHEFLMAPEAMPSRMIVEPWGKEFEAWLAEKIHVLRHGDDVVVALEPSRIHDPLTRVIDRQAISRVSKEAERWLEEALDGYVMRRSGVRLEARRLLAKLLSLERQLERERWDTAKGRDQGKG